MAGLDANTKLLLHCNGADESTTFTDSKLISPHTVTAHGTAQIDTGITDAFGGNSGVALFDGTGAYLTIPDSTDWDVFGSNSDDWTIDLWVYPTETNNAVYIGQQTTNSALALWRFAQQGNNLIFYQLRDNSVNIIYSLASTGPSANSWQHLAFVKVGSNHAIYIDGVQVTYVNYTGTKVSTGALWIGPTAYVTDLYGGYLQELRVQHSNPFEVAVATSDPTGDWMDNTGSNLGTITVPTEAYSYSPVIPTKNQGIIIV